MFRILPSLQAVLVAGACLGSSTVDTAPFYLDIGIAPAVPSLPVLNWPVANDWLNVKTGCTKGLKAVGDGETDDTDAIQACLTRVSNETANYSVYFPPGEYKITKSLTIARVLGGLLIGTGETSRLIWSGAPDLQMLISDGCSRTRFVGLVFDGVGTASVGFEHNTFAPGLFETRIRHQNSKFMNFRVAGIRIGAFTGNGKLETSEVLYENCIFANNGHGEACKTSRCGGIAILNFNDYDNVFDGCYFLNNSYGIFLDKMANAYVRNSRFEVSSAADISFAPSAGNSVRRCVSSGSNAFVVSPAHSAVNPTTIEDNRIDNCTGFAAIVYQLRGPLFVLDNQFTNTKQPPIKYTPWKIVSGAILFAGNMINGQAVSSIKLLQENASNVKVVDLPNDPISSRTNISPSTNFLKSWWPGIPTKLLDATQYGCTGFAHDDATVCAQATIDAAMTSGNGAAAYFPPGTYSVNKSIVVKSGGNFSVLGAGFKTVFQWSSSANADPAVFVVNGGGYGLKLAHFCVESGARGDLAYDTKILHKGSGDVDIFGQTTTTTVYDEIYTSVQGAYLWNMSGFRISGLGSSEIVHFIHLDGNLEVEDSASGTVFLNFMIQGSLNISGAVLPTKGRTIPSVSAVTMVGLTDHDLNVHDDQSVVITDYYSEQIKTGHLTLSGSGRSGGGDGGRVTIAAVKSQCYTPNEVTIDNYHGSLYYSSSFFFEGPPVKITQKGSAFVNISFVANAFWGDNSSAVTFELDSGAKGRLSLIANLLADYSSSEPQTQSLEDVYHTGTDVDLSAAIRDFRGLGALDIALNHPDIN